jgi:hypothetical protein
VGLATKAHATGPAIAGFGVQLRGVDEVGHRHILEALSFLAFVPTWRVAHSNDHAPRCPSIRRPRMTILGATPLVVACTSERVDAIKMHTEAAIRGLGVGRYVKVRFP